MNMAGSATSSESIHTPTTAWESRSTTEAMQRVADVMIAVTESFRQQFRDQQNANNRSSGDRRASRPNLVSPVPDEDVTSFQSQPSLPSAATSIFGVDRPGSVSPLSPVSLASNHNPAPSSFSPPDVLAPLPIDNFLTSNRPSQQASPNASTRLPRPATISPNFAIGVGLQRGLAPEALAHPSEYPGLFEAARKIVITQRERHGFDIDLGASRDEIDQSEDHALWARRSNLYQKQPVSEKATAPGMSIAQEISLLAVVSLYQILMFAGASQVIAPALDIAASFDNLSTGQHSWFLAAYAMTIGVFAMPSARLGDILGHKPVVIFGCLWLAVSCLLSGFATKVQDGGLDGAVYFCICRALQGVGSALCVPNGFSILEASFDTGQKKDMALSLYSAMGPFGFVVGAIMSSLFAVNDAWEWSYFVLAAVCASAAGLSLLVLPPQGPRTIRTDSNVWTELDGLGIILGSAGLILLGFVWNQAPAVGWRTPYVYFLLIIGAMFFAAFLYNETIAKNPLVPLRAMDTANNLILGCTAAGWGCFIIWAFYSFQLVEVLRDRDPLLASVGFVPLAVEAFAVGLLLAYLTPGIEVYWAFIVSLLGFLLGSVLMATASENQTYWANTFVSNLLVPLGIVMINPLSTVLLSNGFEGEYQSVAGSLVLSITFYSASIALAMARCIEVQVNQGGQAILSGYRGAQYFGSGLAGLGVLLASALLAQYSITENA
ncbi:aminotriazole resistance protein [Colletotrichum plurivorum]|uniref:Aminotriazole resistance protein n=1 Tax=Colletotrichum plurivorum TaxID=2175906 RepID=A0A8H6KPP9_9PEZI|nr:aminotriazole resistance protein [Colletotrichum plurivorum]